MPLLLLSLRATDAALALWLVCAIQKRRLRPRYKSFSNWLLVSGMIDAGMLWLPSSSLLYAKLWAVTQPILWALQLLAVQEVMGLIFEQYPRIGSAAKVITASSFIVGVAAAGVSVLLDMSSNNHVPVWLDAAWYVTRYISWASCFVLLAQSLWFAWFPVPMVPNVRTHRRLFTLYAGVLPGAALAFGNMGSPAMNDLVDAAYLAGMIVLLCCWLICLRSDREYSPLTIIPTQRPKSFPNSLRPDLLMRL